jgi:hypothetical protein
MGACHPGTWDQAGIDLAARRAGAAQVASSVRIWNGGRYALLVRSNPIVAQSMQAQFKGSWPPLLSLATKSSHRDTRYQYGDAP